MSETHESGPLVVCEDSRPNPTPSFEVRTESGKAVTGWGVVTQKNKNTARLLAAAYTSYDRHFGINAVQAAEDDVLGDALDVCRRLLREDEDGEYTIGLIEDASDVLSRLPSSKE